MTAGAGRLLTGASLPARLLDLDEPPASLYVRGELPRGPAVAIVGTRKPSAEGLAFARKLAADLGRAGVTVLSGGAHGIDAAAHEGALLVDAPTVVVAPSGYDRPYPEDHAALYARVLAAGGAYVSLAADSEPAQLHAFFARNACLCALAHAVVIVEASYRSGARNAAATARKLGRALFAVPHSPWNRQGLGCNQELRLGARLLESARDVLRHLESAHLHPLALPGLPPHSGAPSTPGSAQLPLGFEGDDEKRVLGEMVRGAAHPDEICAHTGLTAARVQGLVLTLTLKGALVPGPDGRLRVAASGGQPQTSPRSDPGTSSQESESTYDFE